MTIERKEHGWLDTRASVLPIVAFSFLAMTTAVGASIDLGRAQLVQSKLSSALDAAGLAGASTVNTADLEVEVNKFLDANFQGYMGATITNVTVTPDASNTVFTLSATAELPTSLMYLVGHDKIEVVADSEITRAISGLELVMVLDNTGSMAGTGLSGLKTAALDLVDILYGDKTEVDDLWIGLVPFSQAVNVGSTRTTWLDGTTFNWGPTSWAGCVDARYSGNDTTDTPPASASFKAYYWPDDSSNNWYSVSRSGRITYNTPLNTTSRGPNLYCPQAVTPMTASRTTIESGINAMQAVGATHINLGAVWGWRMLSPRWRGVWGGEMDTNSLPLDYNTPRMNKAAIIMTDGENTAYTNIRTAYGYMSEGRLGSTSNTATAAATLDSKLSSVCTSMKNNNIIVYTIAFNNPGTNVENLLRNCATQPDYFFDSPTTTELNSAFRAIGDSLSNLRVSK